MPTLHPVTQAFQLARLDPDALVPMGAYPTRASVEAALDRLQGAQPDASWRVEEVRTYDVRPVTAEDPEGDRVLAALLALPPVSLQAILDRVRQAPRRRVDEDPDA